VFATLEVLVALGEPDEVLGKLVRSLVPLLHIEVPVVLPVVHSIHLVHEVLDGGLHVVGHLDLRVVEQHKLGHKLEGVFLTLALLLVSLAVFLLWLWLLNLLLLDLLFLLIGLLQVVRVALDVQLN